VQAKELFSGIKTRHTANSDLTFVAKAFSTRLLQRSDPNNTKSLFLHVVDWPENRMLVLEDFPVDLRSAVYLTNGEPVDFRQDADSIKILLQNEPLDPYATVIQLDLAEAVAEP
jgi:hypothetical protein